jgi:hypothetical protein
LFGGAALGLGGPAFTIALVVAEGAGSGGAITGAARSIEAALLGARAGECAIAALDATTTSGIAP